MVDTHSVRLETTALLESAGEGDASTLDRLVPLVYEELRRMAHRQLARESALSSMGTTALVHEAYLRLVDSSRVTSFGRGYFFAAAARVMRQILVDHARRRKAEKRGGGVECETLDEESAAVDAYAEEILDLDDALRRLGERSSRQVTVVECRFFAGMTVEETADVLAVSSRTVESDWAMARAWLFDTLSGKPKPQREPDSDV
jgi:RNA polymerase sigma factor (TIGR02999 family)